MHSALAQTQREREREREKGGGGGRAWLASLKKQSSLPNLPSAVDWRKYLSS